jgi:small subunit ribosomal protein S20
LPKRKATSAVKAARVSEKKRAHNRAVKSAIKTKVTTAHKLIASNETEKAKAAVTDSISIMDKAAKRKILHPNTASRRKSRLMKKLNKTGAASKATEAKPAKSKAKAKKT